MNTINSLLHKLSKQSQLKQNYNCDESSNDCFDEGSEDNYVDDKDDWVSEVFNNDNSIESTSTSRTQSPTSPSVSSKSCIFDDDDDDIDIEDDIADETTGDNDDAQQDDMELEEGEIVDDDDEEEDRLNEERKGAVSKKLSCSDVSCSSETDVWGKRQVYWGPPRKCLKLDKDVGVKSLGINSGSHEEDLPSDPCSSSTIPENDDDDELDDFYELMKYNDQNDFDSDDWSDLSDEFVEKGVPDNEVEEMLEEGIPKKRKRWGRYSSPMDGRESYTENEKVILEDTGYDHFDVLPEGWIQVTHNSGMPLYLDKSTRVCTFCRPYFLGPGSLKKHEIPLSAIPCLQNLKIREERENKGQGRDGTSVPEEAMTVDSDKISNSRNACIETAKEYKVKQSLRVEQVREYCQKLFEFEEVEVEEFRKKSARYKEEKEKGKLDRPMLPENTKLIKFPIGGKTHVGIFGNSRPKKERIINPNGKSHVCILHEYIQHTYKMQPSYVFHEIENEATPYSATVMIDGKVYGSGVGAGKKQAKLEAAKKTLEILIPEMKEKIEGELHGKEIVAIEGRRNRRKTDLSFFDQLKIEDPRVAEICQKTTDPSPYSILLTCLSRHFGLGETHIQCHMKSSVGHHRSEFTMSVGVHTASVICKNKRDGKQRTSQAILQALHPHITSWGSLLRMYGSDSIKTMKEKREEQQEITILQNKASVNSPNFAILEKLYEDMRKIKLSCKRIGKFVPPEDESLPSMPAVEMNIFEDDDYHPDAEYAKQYAVEEKEP